MIPHVIFQTHKTQDYIDKKQKIKKAQESWKKHSDDDADDDHFYVR